jgi:hypothetical protein
MGASTWRKCGGLAKAIKHEQLTPLLFSELRNTTEDHRHNCKHASTMHWHCGKKVFRHS